MSTDAQSDPVTWFDTDSALRTEANAVHKGRTYPDGTAIGDIPRETVGKSLYRELHRRAATALCLSGGGIRSASFALGIIEALAVHPRPATNARQSDKQADDESASYLRQCQYLSTVSGGGYIGSWLSAWIARAGYAHVWPELIGRRAHPEEDSSEIAWLRSYSNYLTPRTGLLSADTWAAIALYVRNLMLNWLVILPALCLFLLGVKTIAILAFWLSALRDLLPLAFVGTGVALMVWALRFALLNRPSRDPCTIVGERARGRSDKRGYASAMQDPHHNEAARQRAGADEPAFLKRCLLPALAAALLLSLYLVMRGPKLADWGLFKAAWVSMLAGIGIYALAWIFAWPPKTWVPCRDEETGAIVETRESRYWLRDFAAWLGAGAVYGVMIGLGVHIVAKYLPWVMIGNAFVDYTTAVFLLAFTYGIPWIVSAQLTAEMVFVGLTSWQPYSDSDREWFGRSTGWFAAAAFLWFAAAFLVLIAGETLWYLIRQYDSAKYGSALLAAASGIYGTLVGKSAKTAATEQSGKKSPSLLSVLLPLAAIVFLLLLVLAISVAMDHLMFEKGVIYSALMRSPAANDLCWDLLWLAVGFAVVGVVAFLAWRAVNINRFSAHSIYRNRLIRAYLGASNPERAPNPFTGFDEGDNIEMKELWPAKEGAWQPFHVVNIALNVVNSNRLAWQERKAVSLTMTPLHCGSAADGLGYRDTKEYGDRQGGGISLGTAVAISGAAASPNMGYHSSPVVTLLLALFNVRLGWWLGNPGRAGDATYGEQGPSNAIRPFIAEMFGRTTDDSEYVYLSDGGHFENLGLYEMIRRRCRCIVISDAACDPDYGFHDLGNAVRKIAIDLGVYVSFGKLHELQSRPKDKTVLKGAYYAIGEIDYKTAPENGPDPGAGATVKTAMDEAREEVENGYILYIKPGYHGTESPGIVAYAAASAAFPHESTGDQFFSESQFESYRTLGFEIMDGILRGARERVNLVRKPAGQTPSLADLIKELAKAS